MSDLTAGSLCRPMSKDDRRLSIERIEVAAYATSAEGGSPHYTTTAIFLAYVVHRIVKARLLFCIIEEIHLIAAIHQAAKADTHEAYE